MSEYRPDKWVVVKITGPEYPPIHKVFACWYGGWAGSDSWKLNSGITQVNTRINKDRKIYSFEGSSGSVYECHEDCYGYNMYGGSVLNGMIEKAEKNGITIEILPEETNWLEINYE
jgi:hypothetical protein